MKTDKTQTPENTNNGAGRLNKLAYRDGSLYKNSFEDNFLPQVSTKHKNTRVAKGLGIAVVIGAIAGLLGGSFLLINQVNQRSMTPVKTAPVPTENQR